MQTTGKNRVKDIKGKKYKNRRKSKSPGRAALTSEQKETFINKVKGIAEPLCNDEKVVLVNVAYVKEGNNDILRIFIDKPGGITLDDCSRISMQLGDLLDVNLDIGTSYRLEVSSPGI
ncbi:MAG: hypothetical protein KJ737_15265 [Proteobacteria bacterium]|nr:hypothetical protein [Pseudomonadota bacterium]